MSDIRTWIKIIYPDTLREGVLEVICKWDHTIDAEEWNVTVFQNPSKTQLKAAMIKWNDRARLILDIDSGDLFVWKSTNALHFHVRNALGLSYQTINAFVLKDGIGIRGSQELIDRDAPILKSDSNIIAAMGKRFKIFSTNTDL